MNLGIGFIFTDSLSRVAAVSGVLLSRDPHLAAIGFVFTPLTAFAQLPLGFLGHWWPELLRWNLTAVAMSAPFMAGTVIQVRGIARDRGCSTVLVVVLTALFALNPMIVMYAANGMSEAPFLFFVCWAVRRLIRWIRSDGVHDLITAGLALALAYLTRYDAIAPMFVAGALVGLISLLRYRPTAQPARGDSWWAAAIDVALVVAPGVAAFVAWSLTSWLITGTAFQQFSSVYGNSAILEQAGGNTTTAVERALFSLSEMAVLAPALPVLLLAAAILAIRRRDAEILVPVALFGSVLGTQSLLYLMDSTFPFLRFYITIIPLAFVLVVLLAPSRAPVISHRPGHAAPPPRPIPPNPGPSPLVALAVSMLVGSTAITTVAMGNARLAALEHSIASAIVPGRQDPAELAILRTFGAERRIAEYLDALNLPDGSVLLDTVEGFAVVTASNNPKQFVITSDTDFTKILDDPAGHGVQYILAVPNTKRGIADAVNRRYPTMFETGSGGVGALVLEMRNDGGTEPEMWRLYRVTGQLTPGG
ncbi:ABC transporter [Rhodococcus sp. ABRD24]|uniref:glycosyltransferase family 39 protein n=1 Tax=Rhodococcus sp. ABRD24 TaxID=2507582 RepID=UPI00103CB87A|nr:glycosyltransferase family 39 protein [Rhodococcus sp. ABRD24]QBJ98672.1 ABC transporter [Rhodococcus sp. ABRD24]